MESEKDLQYYQKVPISEKEEIKSDSKDTEIKIQHVLKKLEYEIDEKPPWSVIIFYSIQQISTSFVGPLTVVFLLRQCLCLQNVDSGMIEARLLCTSMFMMGLATFLQCTVGIRLPVIQGSAASFLVPVIALMSTEKWICPESNLNETISNINGSSPEDEAWLLRLREINGCMIWAAVFQILLGCTGVIGLLMKFIGPLTMGPTISLLGLSLCKPMLRGAQQHWGVTWFVMLLMATFTLILGNVRAPCVSCDRKKGIKLTYLKIFKLFPMLITIALAWLLCLVLTVTDILPDDPGERGYMARTDAKVKVIQETPWFIFPYPGQFGMPTASIGGVIGMLTATVATTFDSLGDYYATAKVVQVAPPPKHAVNRGIMLEGIACLISGSLGACHPTTSYSSAIGFIGLTGVGSLRIWQVMGILCMALGILGKVGAVLAIIPAPIITGGAIVGISFVLASGISMLQFVDLNSPRNLFIIGFAHMIGTMIPEWINNNPTAINTGNDIIDQSLIVFLKTGMCVGGILAMVLDNVLPGTEEERGIIAFRHEQKEKIDIDNMEKAENIQSKEEKGSPYDIPFIGKYFKYYKCFQYIPILPTYTEDNFNFKCFTKRK